MHHCWTLLEHNEKWIARDNDKPQSKRRKSSNSPDPNYASADGDEDEEVERGRSPTPSSTAATNNRPPGRKQSKEKAKRDEGGGYKEALREMMTTKKEIEAGKKEEKNARWTEFKAMEERKVAIQEAMMMHKKKKEQHRIMFMDITHFDETQTAFVHAKRSQILAELLSSTMGGHFRHGRQLQHGGQQWRWERVMLYVGGLILDELCFCYIFSYCMDYVSQISELLLEFKFEFENMDFNCS